MKKRILSLLLVLAIFVSFIPAMPIAAASSVNFTFTVTDGKVTITGCESTPSGAITIPGSLDGYPVTTIGTNAFYNCDAITKVSLPDSITSIGYYAFRDCDGLTEINIPNSLTGIGDSAFADCGKLNTINIPNSVKHIGNNAFYNCDNLISITIGSSVATILTSAFGNCAKLTGIWVSEDNPNYSCDNQGVLFDKDKTKLICAPGAISGSYSIPNSVITIDDYAFEETKLESVVFGNKVTTIGHSAFQNCDKLTSVTIGSSVATIGFRAFQYCSKLRNVMMGNNVSYIDSYAFAYCNELKTITFLGNAPSIKYNAFCEVKADVLYPTKNNTWTKDVMQNYGGTISWGADNGQSVAAKKYFVEFSDTDNEFEYPIYNQERFEKQLTRWMLDSEYASIFVNYLDDNTLSEFLEMTIDIPVVSNDSFAYSIQGQMKIKDLIAYIIFADVAQEYIDAINQNVLGKITTGISTTNKKAYIEFYKKVQNFSQQFYYFQEKLNGSDSYFTTLQHMLLIKTALAATEDMNWKYVTDIYKANVSESPELYDDIRYFLLSGGDTSYLNGDYAKTLKGYAMILKNTKVLAKIALDPKYKVADNIPSVVSLGLDNLTYFAETYEFEHAETIKDINNAWSNANTAIDIVKTIGSGSLFGIAKISYSAINAYIDTVKKVFTNAQNIETGWYALAYYYLGKKAPNTLKAIVNPDTGAVQYNSSLLAQYGYGYDKNDVIIKSIMMYLHDTSFALHTYTPKEDLRMYLWDACNDMIAIEKVDCDEYIEIMLQYILAELNFENGLMGASFDVTVSSSDNTLGSVSGGGAIDAGKNATLTAYAYDNVSFAGWRDVKSGDIVSHETSYTFMVTGNANFTAQFVAGNYAYAKAPQIVAQPQSATYYAGQTAEVITLNAVSPDGGTLSVDWYVNSTNKNSGGTYVGSGMNYTPSTSEKGTKYYYAIVRNQLTSYVGTNAHTTTAQTTTRTAKITVNAPVITGMQLAKIPENRVYCVNQEIDRSGITVRLDYSDGSSVETDIFSLAFDNQTPGTKTVTVSSFGFQDAFTVEVKALPRYTVTWVVDGVEVSESYEHGAIPVFKGSTDKASDDTYTYSFMGWDKEIMACTADEVYTAQYLRQRKDGMLYFVQNGMVIINAYMGNDTVVTIPEEIEGLPVTTIEPWAFSDCGWIAEIHIPESVTVIGEFAFYGCSNLKDAYYSGTENQWGKIVIGSGNEDLTSASIRYGGGIPEPDPTQPTVAPTQPTVAPTQPTVTPTQPTVAPTQPTVAPTIKPTEAPTQTPTAPTTPADPTMQKIDLTGCVVGICSMNSASQSDYSMLSWYSTANPNWRNLSIFIDGDLTNEIHWGVGSGERADVYLDLSSGANGYTAVDQFKLYHSGYRAVSTIKVVLLLADGTHWEETYTTNWQQNVSADPLICTLDQTYNAVGMYVWQTNNTTASFGEIELYQYIGGSREPTEPTVAPTEPTETPSEPSKALVGTSYSIRMMEPWALRTNIRFFGGTVENPTLIPLADIASYGAYAIIEHKFDNAETATVADLIADSDTKVYTSAAGNIAPGDANTATTVVFDFTDEIYTYRLEEKVYWVAYYEDAEGQIHYTDIKSTTIIQVADTVGGQANVSAEEKAVLASMKELKQAVIDFRGEDAELGGTTYPAGVALNNSGISFNQNGAAGTYKFGTSHQIRLIEPWSIRVQMSIYDANVQKIDCATTDVNYGMIFYHDKTGAYAGGMSIEQMLAEGDALVYSTQTNNIEIVGDSAVVVYDKGIYTYELDTNLYCLPYVEANGEYYYRSEVICWNLLDQMEIFSQNTSLSEAEIAVFEAMIDLLEKTLAYRGN